MFKKYFYGGKETNYSVSDDGQIRNDKTGKLLKGTYLSCEYHKVELVINNKPKTFMVHRLVAETFLPNPNNLPVVHHIDNNPINNNINNLKWVSVKENGQPENQKSRTYIDKKVIDYFSTNWKDIPEYENYQACKEGFIYNKKTKRVLQGSLRNGYKRVTIDGKLHSVHILVYETFVEKIPKGFVIDHINGIRDDNRIENLRCVSQSENMKNAHRNGHKGQQKVRQYDLEHNFIKEYPNLTTAAKEFDVTYRAIASAAERGGTSCGFYWEKVKE